MAMGVGGNKMQQSTRRNRPAGPELTRWENVSMGVFIGTLVCTVALLVILPLGTPSFIPSSLWEGFMRFGIEASAFFAGTLGTFLTRLIKVSLRPSEQDKSDLRPYCQRWGKVWGTTMFSATSLSPWALVLLFGDLFIGFFIADLITMNTYHLSASKVIVAVVVGYWQNYPGVLLSAGKTIFSFLGKGKIVREEYKPGVSLALPEGTAWWKWVLHVLQVIMFIAAPIVMIYVGVRIIVAFQILLYSGFGTQPGGPTLVQIAILAVWQYWVGVSFGWVSYWASTVGYWLLSNRIPRSFPDALAALYEVQRAATLSMLAILPGPLSQAAGTGMVTWRGGAMSGNQSKALYTVYSQVAGNLILLGSNALQIYFLGKGKNKKLNGNGTH
jgi:hypothetical protein